MYNRYIGNTGKFYRVEDVDDIPKILPAPASEPDRREVLRSWEEVRQWEAVQEREDNAPPPPKEAASERATPPPPAYSKGEGPRGKAPPPPEKAPQEPLSKFHLGKMLQMPGTLRHSLREKLPAGLDLGDVLLVLVLFYLFLEGDDDDMLIVLGILLFTWLKPLLKRGDHAE